MQSARCRARRSTRENASFRSILKHAEPYFPATIQITATVRLDESPNRHASFVHCLGLCGGPGKSSATEKRRVWQCARVCDQTSGISLTDQRPIVEIEASGSPPNANLRIL